MGRGAIWQLVPVVYAQLFKSIWTTNLKLFYILVYIAHGHGQQVSEDLGMGRGLEERGEGGRNGRFL